MAEDPKCEVCAASQTSSPPFLFVLQMKGQTFKTCPFFNVLESSRGAGQIEDTQELPIMFFVFTESKREVTDGR